MNTTAGSKIKMRRGIVLLIVGALLCACVADTMKSYVGRDVREVELAYGPPSNVIDLGSGRRAYQWTRVSVSSTPVQSVSTTTKDKRGRRTTETAFIGGEQSVSRCLYTFTSAWDAARNSWTVTGFRQPSFDCAVGDINE
jgi:hypothetical protein